MVRWDLVVSSRWRPIASLGHCRRDQKAIKVPADDERILPTTTRCLRLHYTKCDTSWGYRGRKFHRTVRLTLCLQPASLKGQRTRALPQLSFTWLARSSRAMLGVPHWFGHWTGNRGQWYWWFCRRKSVVRLADSRRNRNSCYARPHFSRLSGRWTDLDGIKDKLLAAVFARLRALGTLRHAVLGQ